MNFSDPHTLDLIRTLAAVFTAFVAFSALMIAVTQLIINRKVQIENRVKNLYAKYLEKSVDWAPISAPNPAEINWQEKKLYGCKINFSKYIWYLSFTLDTCEEIFLLTKEKTWIDTIDYQIRIHRYALQSDYITRKKVINLYRPEFAMFVRASLASEKEAGVA